MKPRRTALILGTVTLFAQLLAATPGTFRGRLVKGGEASPRWIYVQSRNGFLRKVEISTAQVVWDQAVPRQKRDKVASDALREGTEVRVTAEQDKAGEWHASRVEILKVAEPLVIEPEPPREPISIMLT